MQIETLVELGYAEMAWQYSADNLSQSEFIQILRRSFAKNPGTGFELLNRSLIYFFQKSGLEIQNLGFKLNGQAISWGPGQGQLLLFSDGGQSFEVTQVPAESVHLIQKFQRVSGLNGEPQKAQHAFLIEGVRILKLGLACLMTQCCESSYLLLLNYSRVREQGGRKIENWSGHRRQMAKLLVQLRLWEKLLEACSSGIELEALGVQLQEAVPVFVSKALELMGGIGYMRECQSAELFEWSNLLSNLLGPLPNAENRFFDQYAVPSHNFGSKLVN